ncbi:NADH-quinone oxidoreductase subunit N [Candidatus Liberibacter solanacearum]|uniref:NADH-quinone oxidoreductase subunit N n=1 Tax=Candidatus Liberibacter solanacearum TaxID=556287 RepID=A0A3R7RJ52_9HYPH|nr:NADH-quinone oxidoreductase subunit N [Candidatus Liberibacter solanacearum]RPD36931.1 NADH-quinone oxidoreductase subunit N [Candidatus Liberibacter solanacearum]
MIPISFISDFFLCIPEIIIALGSLFLLLMGVFSRRKNAFHLVVFPVIVLSVALISLFIMPYKGIGLGGAYISDSFSYFAKSIILGSSIMLFIMMFSCIHVKPFSCFEFPVVILMAILGMLCMISANDMMSFYMALELQSLALYVVIAMNRESVFSIEAALKYFVLGAVSSAFLLYGMSFIYGFTGYTDFSHIVTSLFVGYKSSVVIVGVVLILVGLFFKMALVPFHMWIPDVYEGSPMFVTAFLATVPKFAITMALYRIISVFWPMIFDLLQIFMLVSVGSMVLGSIVAIKQQDLKRLMAYSSIGHAGYALLGFSAGTVLGISAMIRYMIIYLVMMIGFFACVLSLRRKDGSNIKNISDLSGLSKQSIFLTSVLTILIFSLAGIPPFAGFLGKYFLLLSAVNRDFYIFAMIGLLSSVVSAYYYLRIVSIMWFNQPTEQLILVGKQMSPIIIASTFFVVGYFLFENILNSWITTIVRSMF